MQPSGGTVIDIKEVVGGAGCGRQGANREAICREQAALFPVPRGAVPSP